MIYVKNDFKILFLGIYFNLNCHKFLHFIKKIMLVEPGKIKKTVKVCVEIYVQINGMLFRIIECLLVQKTMIFFHARIVSEIHDIFFMQE